MAILLLAFVLFSFPPTHEGLERTTVFVSRSSIGSQPGRADPSDTIYNFGYDDERRALRAELDKCRQENETLRQSYASASAKRLGNNDQDKSNTPFAGQSVQTTGSFDSGLDSSAAGTSTTPRNNNNNNNTLQLELNECRERERRLNEQIHSLRKVRSSCERMNCGIDALLRLVATGIDLLTSRRGE